MQKNDIIELKIEDMGVDGEGIGKYDGMTFFVKDAVLGNEIEARITKMKKNYGTRFLHVDFIYIWKKTENWMKKSYGMRHRKRRRDTGSSLSNV